MWFGDPRREALAEETGDGIVLMKDDRGRVIGFEKLNFHAADPGDVRVVFETATV